MLHEIRVPPELLKRFDQLIKEGWGVPQAIRQVMKEEEEKNGPKPIPGGVAEVPKEKG